ncbi:MAG: hypothetical protein JWO97_1042, partial [Acidobacteria bacterium]|nr:hypothetical protein [Acidobacteriota bacterium]
MDLTRPPEPLSNRQRALVAAVAIVCAATRFLAIARSLWDWDEVLFCLGMRLYDVTNHHPHPPGFPIYIGLAHIARLFAPSDFRALQSINVIAALFVFPAVFFFARELRLRFTTCIVAALLFAFFPNVWFFGGTAFSDIPSIVLVLFAAALLLRGCRDANSYLIGTLLLALAIGIRPQNFLVGLAPGLIATWYRARDSFRDVVFAALIGVATVTLAFGSAIHATGSFERYMVTVRAHGEYISRVDSFRAPERPPLWRLADRFFIKQYQSPPLSVVMSLFVLASLVGAASRRDRSILLNILTFAPFALSAWLMLDRFSINRFSIGYAPMFAILAADGIARISRGREQVEATIGVLLAGAFFVWTYPGLAPVRNDISPSVLAVQAVKQHIDPHRDQLFVSFSMTPFVEYFAPNIPFIRVQEQRAMPLTTTPRRPFLLTEVTAEPPRGWFFKRERERLWNIARRHYFEVDLHPLRELPRFGAGWYAPERSAEDEARWMAGRSTTILPPADGASTLRLDFRVPGETASHHPRVTVTFNGKVIDRFP